MVAAFCVAVIKQFRAIEEVKLTNRMNWMVLTEMTTRGQRCLHCVGCPSGVTSCSGSECGDVSVLVTSRTSSVKTSSCGPGSAHQPVYTVDTNNQVPAAPSLQ